MSVEFQLRESALSGCRRPDADRGIGEPEPARHHADHGARTAIERHVCADDGRIAAQLLPQAKTEQGHPLGARDVIALPESTSEQGSGAEHIEELGRCRDTRHQARGSSAGAEHRVALAVERHLPEPRRPSTYVQVLFVRPVGLHPEHAELAFMRVGQRAQEHAVRHAEYGSCTADAESKREHREQGIHGTPPEDTNGIPAVLRQLFHTLPSPDRPRILLHQGDIAELQQGLTTRLFWRHSAIEVVARFALDVVADVVVERCPVPVGRAS